MAQGAAPADRRSRIRGCHLGAASVWWHTVSDEPDFGFDAPAYKPEAALLQLKRSLRELGLAERGDGCEQRGRRIVEWRVDGATLVVRLVRKPATTSAQWDAQTLKNAADQRQWLAEVKKRLERWRRDDD